MIEDRRHASVSAIDDGYTKCCGQCAKRYDPNPKMVGKIRYIELMVCDICQKFNPNWVRHERCTDPNFLQRKNRSVSHKYKKISLKNLGDD